VIAVRPDGTKEHRLLLFPTFRSYFWELASEASLHCRDDRNLSLAKPLLKPFSIQTAECGLFMTFYRK
jgi:hypothetical protein